MTLPTRADRYQLPSYPPTDFTRDLWNFVFEDIAIRIEARESLEATFEALQEQGIQASLNYIQATVAPQIATLQQAAADVQYQIDSIAINGSWPDSLKLGGELPAYYATAADLTSAVSTINTALEGKVPTSRKVNGHALTGNVTVTAEDVGMGLYPADPADLGIPSSVQGALDGINTALDGKVPTSRTVNGKDLSADVTIDKADVGLDLYPNDPADLDPSDAVAGLLGDKQDVAPLTGMMTMFATAAAPTGFLEADGSLVSRTTYAALFAAIGETFGVGDGSTTFELPTKSDPDFIWCIKT